MINRRDALKTIAGTALIPFVGITPARTALNLEIAKPSNWFTVVVRCPERKTLGNLRVWINPEMIQDASKHIFDATVKQFPEATEIIIQRDGFLEVVFTKDPYTNHLDQDTWCWLSRKPLVLKETQHAQT